MVEYVLFVIRGLDIDNVLFEIDGLEVLIMDGSVGLFVKVLLDVGIEE